MQNMLERKEFSYVLVVVCLLKWITLSTAALLPWFTFVKTKNIEFLHQPDNWDTETHAPHDIRAAPVNNRCSTLCGKVGTLLTPANWESSWCLEGWVCSSTHSRCLWQNRKSHWRISAPNNIYQQNPTIKTTFTNRVWLSAGEAVIGQMIIFFCLLSEQLCLYLRLVYFKYWQYWHMQNILTADCCSRSQSNTAANCSTVTSQSIATP